MTIKKRTKKCITCLSEFTERARDSNKEWLEKECCSQYCYGNSQKRKDRVISIFDRLERYQIKRNGCWGGSGNDDGHGYGTLSNRRGKGYSPEKAHRISYEKHCGEIPKGLYVCHKCDNPECTNPDHLFTGTAKENSMDCSAKGRLNKKSLLNLSPLAGAKLNENDVLNIRSSELIKKELSLKFNVSIRTIEDVINRKTWRKI